MKIGVISLGCPKNTADTEALIAELPQKTKLVDVPKAEIVLLNTCAFLKTARDEVYAHLAQLKNKKVILLGCLAKLLTKTFFKKYPQVYAVVNENYYPELKQILTAVQTGQKIFAVEKETLQYVDLPGKLVITPPSYAYLKIAEGCNNACSFCLIPHLKGGYRSRPMESIMAEACDLIALGVKELILVAQDTGYYGVDLYGKPKLTELLKKLANLNGDFWVRLMYVYPERISDELLRIIKKSKKICHYLDLPLQHGDAKILQAMRRPADVAQILQKICLIREIIPNVALRTSLIVGFPGETAVAFQNLQTFVEEINFDHVGVFEYSREKGSAAYTLKNQIPTHVKKQRRDRIMQLQQKISFDQNLKYEKGEIQVLIESYDARRKIYLGRTEYQAPKIDGQVLIKSAQKLKLNQFYSVSIFKADVYDLWGEIIC